MRIHHLNCATFCPPCSRLINGAGGLFAPGHMVGHCLLLETPVGLILVDSGLGLQDIRSRERRLGRSFLTWTRPQLDPAETAIRQIAQRGFSPQDVRHILVTHLDVDHAGGLADFPQAKIHVDEREFEAALEPASTQEARRYRRAQFSHYPDWVIHEAGSDRWFGFACIRPIPELADDLLIIPLIGHSRGHCGVALRTSDGWLLHAGDAYYSRNQLSHGRAPLGLEVMAHLNQVDGRARVTNLDRLRRLAADAAAGVRVFCAHDPQEWRELTAPQQDETTSG